MPDMIEKLFIILTSAVHGTPAFAVGTVLIIFWVYADSYMRKKMIVDRIMFTFILIFNNEKHLIPAARQCRKIATVSRMYGSVIPPYV